MNQKDYLANAKPNVNVTIDGTAVNASVKAFKTGSVGYNASGKVKIPLANGEVVTYQVALNLIAVGSKEWAKE